MSRWSLIRQWGELRYPRLSHALWKLFLILISIFGVCSYADPPGGQELISLTQEVWSKRLGRPISKDEALQLIRSFANFVSLLRGVKANAK